MAAPTLIAYAEADSANTHVLSEATGTLSWQTGDVLVAMAANEGASNGVTFSISNTGSGLSWTGRITHASASDTSLYAWTAVATATSSGTITATQSSSMDMAMCVWQYRAPSGSAISVGASNSTLDKNASPFTAAITMSGPDSAVCWAMADWGANAGASFTSSPTASSHSSASPGPSALPVGPTTEGTGYTFGFASLDDQVATGSQSFGYTGSGLTSPLVSVGVVEVALTATAAPPRPVFLPLMAQQGM